MALHRIAVAWTFLACVGHGRRVQIPDRSSPALESQKPLKARKALAEFLLTSRPAAAFNLPSAGHHTGLRSAVSDRRRPRPLTVMEEKTAVSTEESPAKKKKKKDRAESKEAFAASRNLPAFRKWCEDYGANAKVPLRIGELPGRGRALIAEKDVPAGTTILYVPKGMSLQVTQKERCPAWFSDKKAWEESKWDEQLAMMLLREEANPETLAKPWISQLPKEVCTPCLRPRLLKSLQNCGFTMLAKDVEEQRAVWDAAYKRAPGPYTKERFDWAISMVRSRAFSGPFTSGNFKNSATAVSIISFLALAYAIANGGAGAQALASSTAVTFIFIIIFTDLVLAPFFSKQIRYVLCPWVDFCNHDTSQVDSEISYEYFYDSFAVTLSRKRGVKSGKELCISYGKRSNDLLLQYYGFVQPDNPFDTYVWDQKSFIVDVDAALPSGLPEKALSTLKDLGLRDSSARVELGRQMANATKASDFLDLVSKELPISIRLTRLLTHPELAKANEEGRSRLPGDAEASALRTIATVATRKAAELRAAKSKVSDEDLSEDESRLLVDFLAAKIETLNAAAKEFEAKAVETST